MENVSKQHKAFLRKLYLAYLIGSEQHNLLSLQQVTGMPRRTLQDAIAAFGDIGIVASFVQSGVRNNAGYYQIDDWGPIRKAWVSSRLPYITSLLAAP
ncbi:MAG: winged helix-turn-helix domain-containing protein [Shewanella sp.]|nr:winged helix-turn-helix domain-containing protein [Shewanella sp.]MCF1432125.1 winged helix-turn-helix domain-containing protein [Shewanella sp.]MCF1439204.1 winged helix-turn-helix domain-containing protein [Shewanella sp.]MCF1457819.1 winged helix-turn-helix domain-containing protein [Shewanella sp.]